MRAQYGAAKENAEEGANEMTVEGWANFDAEEEQDSNILQEKFLNFSEKNSKNKHSACHRNKSVGEVENQDKTVWGKLNNINEGNSSMHAKGRGNRLCEKNRRNGAVCPDFSQDFNAQNLSYEQQEEKVLVCDDFESNIDILKTRAKRLESEEFVSESSCSYKQEQQNQDC